MRIDTKNYNMLISCPSDIVDEIEIIENVVNYYNDTTAYNNYIRLNLRYWKWDSYPLMGRDPQEMLYKQFIKECDFAVAFFWTKFGSCTKKYKSGTEDEIEYFRKQGKDVSIFFSDYPIAPSMIDIPQLKNVRKYKKDIEKTKIGLFNTYKNLREFENQFRHFIYKYMKDKYHYQ